VLRTAFAGKRLLQDPEVLDGYAGPACSPVLPLIWADVDCDRARLRLYAGNAKNRKELWVPLSDDMVARLRAIATQATMLNSRPSSII
jgi:integrase